ncbi:MAG: hypothetical protein LBS28_00840 [Streptococcaceae bacterium]|nr:hypothetical protein [Streptococcaceae bacterium]
MKNVQETLAGRIGILQIYSITTQEIRGIKNNYLVDYSYNSLKINQERSAKLLYDNIFENIFKSGMPEIITADGEERQIYYDTYINTFLMRDVVEIGRITKIFEFRKFLSALAAVINQRVNFSTLAQHVGLSDITIKDL